MNKKVTINGFDEKQVFSLYSYLVAYEESGIQKYTSTKSMLKEHPELSSLEEQTKDVTILKSTATEMKEIDFKEMSKIEAKMT